jgi:hypothetical protein
MRLTKIILIITVLVTLVAGCASGGGNNSGMVRDYYPVWWNAPDADDVFVSTRGMGVGINTNLARAQATQLANNELSRIFGIEVTSYLTNHLEQFGMGTDAIAVGHIQDTGETIARQLLVGVQTIQTDTYTRADGQSVAYIKLGIRNPSVFNAMAEAFESNPHFQRAENARTNMRRLADEAFSR